MHETNPIKPVTKETEEVVEKPAETLKKEEVAEAENLKAVVKEDYIEKTEEPVGNQEGSWFEVPSESSKQGHITKFAME